MLGSRVGVLGRGRGGVQVLERLGPEGAEDLYSPARPRQCRGIQIMCCLCMVGRTYFRYFFREAISGLGMLGSRVGVLGRGRGGVQVLERLWPEGAETVLPRAPAAMQGNTEHVLSLYGGKETYVRCFFGEAISRVGDAGQQGWGCWAGDAGEYRFWNICGLRVLKTCTPPRARGNVGEYRSCADFVWWEGNLRSLLLRRSNKQGCGCWATDEG